MGPEAVQKQLDRIVYLGSLVSDRQQIEPIVERLRELTATKITVGQPLAPENAAALSHIESELTDYLVTKERLRKFTLESLRQHMYERAEAKGLVRRLRWRVACILVLAVLMVVGISLMTFEPASLRRDIALIGGTTVCYLGALFLFLTALKRFSPALGRVYRLFCIGFFIGSVSILINSGLTLAFAHYETTSWQQLWPLNTGLYLEYIPLYIASIELAKLQGVRTIAMNVWVVGGLAIGTAALLALTPTGRWIEPAGGLIAAFTAFAFVLSLASAVLVRRAWKSYTTLYRGPSSALWLTITLATVGWAGFTCAPFFSDTGYDLLSNVSNLLFILAVMALVRAGYLFNKLSRQ